MTHKRPLPSVVDFTQLLNYVTKMKHFSSSLQLFNQMCSLGVPVNQYTTSIAIKCCCHLRQTNDAFSILGFCFKRAIVPDVYTFSALLDGFVLEDRVLEAERFFKKLIKEKICEPNVVMFNTMIKGLCKFGDNVTALSLLRLVDQKGCTPDVVTYNTIIDSLCKDTLIDDAFKLFKEMVFQKGIAPNVITYNTLISGLCKLSQWDKATRILKEKEGKIEEAEGVINIMVDRGKVPDIVTYNALIHFNLCHEGLLGDAEQLFLKMDQSGCPPDNVTYCLLLQGFLNNQHFDDVELLLQAMDGRGYSLDVTTLSLDQ